MTVLAFGSARDPGVGCEPGCTTREARAPRPTCGGDNCFAQLFPLFTLAFGTFALGLGELMIAAVLPPIGADLHVSIPLAGQLVTVSGLTFALLSPPLAVAVRRIPVRRASVAVAAWALTSWGFSPAVNRLLDASGGAGRDAALALNLTSFNVGIAARSALGGAVIIAAGIAQLPFVAAGLCALAAGVALRERRAATA